ncbi:protein KAKU4 isoform X2 [Andrographis paniculata]|uniref:protein KAKU4 isoform X2 n=1 Tax=Andrographis paniculata TaxID=175694 RepID=UPI0021E7B42E|nr:protein KAKU4 isoform X2 [Andrographis paniculata]
MPSSRSGAGGKIVTNRRKQRLAATPYDRPPPLAAPHPPPKNPNWFTGKIVHSARAIFSGAGRIISSILSDSESSSSEDEDSASEDAVDNDNQYGDVIGRSDKEPQLTVRHAETKRLIKQLIMQEIFSREECDELIRALNSRVLGCSTDGKEQSSLGAPIGNEDADIFNKAVEEAKKWFQEKKVGSSSATQFTNETSRLRSDVLEWVDSGGGSPVDVARSYMKERPPWASPTRNFELSTPLTSTMKLFNERMLYSTGPDSLSSSKKRNSLASGSWNIQEELRRVRSKATDDLLRTPSSKIDPSLFAVPQRKEEPVGALGEQMKEPESLWKTVAIDELVDAGVSYDPDLTALGSRQDDKGSEALSSRPAISLDGNNEDPEAVKGLRVDGECAASKPSQPLNPQHTEEHQTDIQRWGKFGREMEARLKQGRELKRLESSVNYDGRKNSNILNFENKNTPVW